MQQIVRRTVGMTAALAAAALFAAGCGDDDKDDAASKASSMVSSAQQTLGQMTSAASSAAAAAGDVEVAAADGTKIKLTGPIAAKYKAATEEQKKNLGLPKTGAENSGKSDKGVVYQQFDGGVITAKDDKAETKAYVTWGKIRDAWNVPRDEKGAPVAGGKFGSAGPLGVSTSDETDAAGKKESTFEHGKITWDPAADKVEVTVNGTVVPAK